MRRLRTVFWGGLVLLAGLWLLATPGALAPASVMALRNDMVQLTGILAMGCMSLAMILAMRPRWPERWFGGLDKMYRLHKWLGIGGLALAVVHWLWSQGPKWAVGFGWMARPQRGPRVPLEGWIEPLLLAQRGTAEAVGEWAFYGVVLLVAVALVQRIPYRLFHRTHRLLALAYLALAFHTVVLTRVDAWASPLGLLMAALLGYGAVAAVAVLLRRVGARRQAAGTLTRLHYYPPLHVLECEVEVPAGWPGHHAGQFAFVTADTAEGAHPFTIASAWDAAAPRLTFIVKELGDYTGRLHATLHPGQAVRVEGPYGCFTFDDALPHQVWIGAGIGITPFIARMRYLALQRAAGVAPRQAIDLFHSTADWSEEAIAKLRTDAAAAGIRLHVLHDARDGRLSGERIRAVVPAWREASLWFCGPVGFGAALRADFARQGFPVARRFHQELFSMR